MFTIEWDTEEVRKDVVRISSLSPRYIDCIDLCTSICVSVSSVDIAGLAENPAGNCTRLKHFFLDNFSVFRSIDPKRLRDKPFHRYYNVDNCVLGEGFRYYILYDRTSDLVTFEYIYTGKKVFQTLQIPLRAFANGVILSAEEMIVEILSVSTLGEDAGYWIFKADLDIIKDWYREVYGVDADQDHPSPTPAPERQMPGIIAIDHPGAVQMVWNRKELEDRIREVSATPYRSDIWKGFEMVFHFFIDDVDIIGGALTYFDSLLVNINWVFHRLDPEHIPQEKTHFTSDEPEAKVSGTVFEFTVTLSDDRETVLIDYMSAQMNYYTRTTVPLKRFARAVVQANEEFLQEAREIWPEVVLTTYYQWLVDDIVTLREWYRERYHEELPPRNPPTRTLRRNILHSIE
ncbi:hypothetical protein [Methanoculleus sp.]|uniref:hypothetical protein n=1 Tax=Methanoculleus sp. TaxID=90427 RepID=UPI002636F577|nr:hypothetical protein [Methanoculleus sp.]MDD2254816.1 hypothetical protein [Methanoculleus sp.]MDD2786911.1 hypothetical protein [Methanoculleus sp.]MDD4471023.1 hypothetical protein [Methanoculleus sp.]HOI60916.1 hypothetical protein [Methanoculleus sp.]